jgi:hypothetical protein
MNGSVCKVKSYSLLEVILLRPFDLAKGQFKFDYSFLWGSVLWL